MITSFDYEVSVSSASLGGFDSNKIDHEKNIRNIMKKFYLDEEDFDEDSWEEFEYIDE